MFHLTGGHWAALQLVAWAGMLRDYTAEKGLVTGISETFDGDHPCPLCTQIWEGKQEEDERQRDAPLSQKLEQLSKWMNLQERTVIALEDWPRELSQPGFARPEDFPAQWQARPITPPPRSGAAA